MDFYGRDFLRILDFSEAELRYMLDTAKHLRNIKKRRKIIKFFRIIILPLFSRKLRRGQDARLRWRRMI